jgi:tyrosyl-tRNA synthetase
MTNVYQTLKERGFIYQSTDEAALIRLLAEKKTTCYVGFDATADSLHVGSLVPIMALVHFELAGHRPIALLGGGTTMVGDPSGKTEMRQMLGIDDIRAYSKEIESQLGRFLSFGEKSLLLNNVEWLAKLNYIEFLRDVGRHFSVNRMLAADSVKIRLEKGLSFIEFNYMLLQAYDFYVLARDQDCLIQMGGQDQWGNIVAGVDLTRRMIDKEVFGMTFPLLMNPSGEKFGKTAAGAVWLDAGKTPVYDFYQFWRNADDSEVEKYLGLFTLLPMEEVRGIPELNINRAKEILAYEVTARVHGASEAAAAYSASVRQFGESDPGRKIQTSSAVVKIESGGGADIPTLELPASRLGEGIWIVRLLVEAGLSASNGEARRLIKQGGAYLNDVVVKDENLNVTTAQAADRTLTLSAGKKRHKRVVFV